MEPTLRYIENEVSKHQREISELSTFYHGLDKSLSLLSMETSAVKIAIDRMETKLDHLSSLQTDLISSFTPDMSILKTNVQDLQSDMAVIKKRHELEDLTKARRKSTIDFMFRNWRFLLLMAGVIGGIFIGGYEISRSFKASSTSRVSEQRTVT